MIELPAAERCARRRDPSRLTTRTLAFPPTTPHRALGRKAPFREGPGLQGLARRFVGHLLRGEFAQFVINQRQELLRRLLLRGADRLEDLRHWFL